ncbi:MAG: hypothetical protein ABS84_14845 [Rubrivivax sp. SCN 71-131]|nr:MAG: hypothetical protein ABS84_14845 [Rubrivivax sp. SCN 71-131]
MPADLHAHAAARPAGQAPERVDLRAGEERTLLLDCRALLGTGELIESAPAATATPAGLRVSTVRSRAGTHVELSARCPAIGEMRGAPWRDYLVTARLRTTRGQVLQAALTLRVHAE